MKDLYKLESSIGYYFKNRDLLILALTHSSAGPVHNERLEFLGDSIGNYYMAYLLYLHFPKISEGEMTIMRASLVNRTTLVKIAKDFKLNQFIRLGNGEIKNGGYNRDSILANVVESLLGAILLDSNIIVVGQVIFSLFQKYFKEVTQSPKDFKTELQEYLQELKLELPCYKVVKVSGKMHQPEFMIQCLLKHLPHLKIFGYGSSKKNAEQESAKQALKALGLLKE